MHRITSRVIGVVSLLLFAPAFADHHGRGQESTQGFPGIYVTGNATFTFTGDGHLIIVIDSSNVAVSVSEYTISDNVLTVRDISPPAFFPSAAQECVKENEGQYALVEEDGEITWTLIDDVCEGRVKLYGGKTMRHYVRSTT